MRVLLLVALAMSGACRAKTLVNPPAVYVLTDDKLTPEQRKARARLVPASTIEVKGEDMPRGHRAPPTIEVWLAPEDMQRGLKRGSRQP